MEENEIFDFGDDNLDNDVVDSGFDQLDQDDLWGNEEDQLNVPDDTETFDDETQENDYINRVLQAKQIDRDNIQMLDEEGNLTTVSFDDLSDEEKADLLSQEAPSEPSGITDNDIAILNYFRANRINSLQEFADGIAQQAVENYIASQQENPVTEIDGYSDDEIIAYDLIRKFGDEMTDEEIDAEIDRLKTDEDAYNKKVGLLRTYYKNEEEAQRKLYEDNQAAQYQQDTQAFQNAYGQAAYALDSIQGMQLEDADKQELLDFVLQKDQFGRTEFAKALDNPDAVLRMAWGLLYGEQASEAQRNYFAQLLSQQRAAAKPAAKQGTRAVSRQTSGTTRTTSGSKSNNPFKF